MVLAQVMFEFGGEQKSGIVILVLVVLLVIFLGNKKR